MLYSIGTPQPNAAFGWVAQPSSFPFGIDLSSPSSYDPGPKETEFLIRRLDQGRPFMNAFLVLLMAALVGLDDAPGKAAPPQAAVSRPGAAQKTAAKKEGPVVAFEIREIRGEPGLAGKAHATTANSRSP